MKTNYKSITTFIVLLSMITIRLGAQLSGGYTINNLVAASATNFTSFATFAASVTTAGVSGPVTVNVVSGSGPYNEQVNFTAIAGTSATNSITINGNGNTITFAGTSSAPWTFGVGGGDFLAVNNLTIVGTGSTYAMVVHLWNQANNNTFSNCFMTCPANGSSSYQINFSLSNSGTSYSTSGDSGNNNVVSSCTLTNGYYGVNMYGNSGTPYTTNNQILNCLIQDFYYYGIYNYYAQSTILSGNTIERPTRTTFATFYGIYAGYQGINILIEKNKIRRPFDAQPTQTSYFCYCIYNAVSAPTGSETIVRNNVISDMNTNYYVYGYINGGYTGDRLYHNTINMDNQNTASSSGYIYTLYIYGTGNHIVKNNLVSVNRLGTGSKYNLYYYNPQYIVSNNNILFNNGVTNGYIGYDGSTNYSNLANWKAGTGLDANSVSADPLFANPASYNYAPTQASLNNIGQPLGVLTDITGFARNLPAPDAGAYEFFNTSCTSTPGANTVTAPTGIVCPAALSNLGLSTYTVNGINYAWGASTTSSLGPFTAIPGATLASITTPTLPVTTWYTATISCANGGSSITATAGQVQIATTVINTVPYLENFEGITVNNQLPNCSWLVNNSNCQTNTSAGSNSRLPHSGNKFASVYGYYLNATDYYYTNGIQLYPGITYSASMFYMTEYYGYTNFAELSIQLGTTQTPTGLVTIATQTPALSPTYKQLSNTFTVATAGVYYVAIKVVSTASSYAYYLSWDDLSITVPCTVPSNVPNTAVSASSSTICSGQSVNLTATGATSYSWNTGAVTSTVSDTPGFNTSYAVTGTNSLTGCSSTVIKNVTVKQSPIVSAFTFSSDVCDGTAAHITASGASTYTWSNGSNSSVLTVTPTGNTTYTVLGAAANGCVGSAVQAINVNPSPTITAVNTPTYSCAGQNVTLTGSGAVNYQWSSSSYYAIGGSVITNPQVTTSYDVIGTDANGCSSKITITQQVTSCLGIQSFGSLTGLSVYPNPTAGVFTIELVNGLNKTIEVTDLTGRVILSSTTSNDKVDMNINNLSNGVYYVKIKSNNAVEVTKIVKQ